MIKKFDVLSMLCLSLALALQSCSTPAAPEPTSVAALTEIPAVVPSEVIAPTPSGRLTAVPPEPTPLPEPVTLKILNYSQEQADFYKEVAVEFQKEYGWITLQWDTMQQNAYNEALPLMFQSNQAPDIFFWKSGNAALTLTELANQGWISPLNGNGDVSEEWKSRWPEGTFIEGINVSEGKVYSFPFNDNRIWGPGYMFYSNPIFSQAGLDPAKPPATWNELLEACRTIKEKIGIYCVAVPLKGTQLQRAWYALAGSSMSDSFFDYKNGRFLIDDPRILKAFNFLQGLFKEDLVVPGVEDHTFMRQAFGNGQAAIYFDGAWMPSTFRQMGFTDLDYGVAKVPYPDDGPRGALVQSYTENKYWVSSQTQQPEAAWLFVEWLTRPNGYFAQEYLKRAFGTLAYADNAKHITDPKMQEVIAVSEGLRVQYPEPVIACPDLAKSKAFLNADAFHKNWEWEAMVEALTSDKDFTPIAKDIATQKNEIFLKTLEEEKAAGLNVSLACYAFSEWDYAVNFDPTNYSSH